MQHPAKGPRQGGEGGRCPLSEELSSCLERNCFALPFTKGNAREANPAARCHMDTKCSLPGLRGEGCWAGFHPAALSPLSCCSSICPGPCWAARSLQDRCWGVGDPLATPELEPFPSFLHGSFVWDHLSVASQELKSVAKRRSVMISLQITKPPPKG